MNTLSTEKLRVVIADHCRTIRQLIEMEFDGGKPSQGYASTPGMCAARRAEEPANWKRQSKRKRGDGCIERSFKCPETACTGVYYKRPDYMLMAVLITDPTDTTVIKIKVGIAKSSEDILVDILANIIET